MGSKYWTLSWVRYSHGVHESRITTVVVWGGETVRGRPAGRVGGGAARRIVGRHKIVAAAVAGALAVLPAVAAASSTATWANLGSGAYTGNAGLQSGYDPRLAQIGVDGSLPEAPTPEALPAYQLPDGPLGVPGTALDAYHGAADTMAEKQPSCHIDWALIASIGRIESNHARGGYLDAEGNTLESILGPVLNGMGPVVAVPDTDQGWFDQDTEWDRAVGPTQFIPATWWNYAADGNGDGEANPNNIYDAAQATARYLCSGGFDMANPDQLHTAIFRYNNSEMYVRTVILWADAYRTGVAPVPDSEVPIGAPNPPANPSPPLEPVPPPPATDITTPPPPTTAPPPTSTTTSSPDETSTTTTPPPTTTTSPSTTTTPPPPTCPTETTTPTSGSPPTDDPCDPDDTTSETEAPPS